MLKYSTDFCGIGLARDLTKDDRAVKKANYIQSRQHSSLTGANAIPLAQNNEQVAQATGQSPPHGEGEPEGT